MKSRKPHLLLCMTPGIGLARWKELGTLERELKPYVAYLDRGWRVTIATYDRREALPELPSGLDTFLCPHRWLLPLAPWFLRAPLRQVDVVKTNQSRRSWWYVAAARLHRRPIMLRCGWLPGSYLETRDGPSLGLRFYRMREGWSFRRATACMVATAADREWLIRHYHVPGDRVHLRPNFVDTDLFCEGKGPATPRSRSVVMVGRLSDVKNPHLLLEACAAARVSRLTMVGEGPEQPALAALAQRLNVPAEFPGSLAQADLPALLRQHEVFALPSKVEGHPKALFEAMACGMACVGTAVPGLREAIRHDETGLLCEPRPASLAEALGRLMGDPGLRRRLGTAARRQVEETLSFQTVMDAEIRQVQALLPDEDIPLPAQPISQTT